MERTRGANGRNDVSAQPNQPGSKFDFEKLMARARQIQAAKDSKKSSESESEGSREQGGGEREEKMN